MNSTFVFAASRDNFLLWHFKAPKLHAAPHSAGLLPNLTIYSPTFLVLFLGLVVVQKRIQKYYVCIQFIFIFSGHIFSLQLYLGLRQRRDRIYHVDDTPSGVAEVIQDLDRNFEVIIIIFTVNSMTEILLFL